MSKYKIEHVFFEIGGDFYKDMTVYANVVCNKYSPEKYTLVVGGEYDKVLSNEIIAYCDKSYTPTHGSEIHVVPDCVLATQDLRNNFSLKRNFDDGTCNVFSEIKRSRVVSYRHFVIVPSKNVAAFLCMSASDPICNNRPAIYKELNELLPPDCVGLDCKYYSNLTKSLTFCACNDSYRMLLLGIAAKPCVHYSQLPMKRIQLTADLLYMIYKEGSKAGKMDSSNYKVQLSALSQTNWKDYPGTIWLLFEYIIKYCSMHYYVNSDAKKQPKQIREILEYRKVRGYKNAEDKALAAELVEMILNVQEGRFTTLKQLKSKLSSLYLTEELVIEFYDTMVKITPQKNEKN